MPTKDRLKLTLPNDLRYLPIAMLYVRETAREFGFAGDDLNPIEIGVEESVTNVIQHAFGGSEAGIFDIICERIPMGIKIIIKEKGIPFDPLLMPQYQPGTDLESVSGSGLGVFLMKQLMDEASFHNLGSEGKETHLVKYLPSKSIEHYYSNS